MVETSVWTADDPERTWQQVRRYQCAGCNVEGVVTVGRDRPNVVGGFIADEPADEPDADSTGPEQTTLIADGGTFGSEGST